MQHCDTEQLITSIHELITETTLDAQTKLIGQLKYLNLFVCSFHFYNLNNVTR